jgi:biotin transporter BioY
MDTHRTTLASMISAVLVVLLMLPILMGGVRGTLFWAVFGVLALYLVATIIIATVNRRRLH